MISALNVCGKAREDGRVMERRRDRKIYTREEK